MTQIWMCEVQLIRLLPREPPGGSPESQGNISAAQRTMYPIAIHPTAREHQTTSGGACVGEGVPDTCRHMRDLHE